jgi:hypothetical protein
MRGHTKARSCQSKLAGQAGGKDAGIIGADGNWMIGFVKLRCSSKNHPELLLLQAETSKQNP